MKKALILGVTGQDGSYLAEILLEHGYQVHGMYRKSATGNTKNIEHIISNDKIYNNNFFLHRGDLADPTSIYRIINLIEPDEIYNEADQDHVSWSYDMVGYSSDITASAVGRLLEIIRQINPKIKFFQPCTSNMFGKTDVHLLNENSKFNPQSPYAIAKTFAYYMSNYYRDSYGMHVSTAILFNHESPRRPIDYLSRKVTKAVSRIYLGKQSELILGDTGASIDWGYAKEYMYAVHQILQLDKPDDYIIATGVSHTVKQFVEKSFNYLGLDSNKYVFSSPDFVRPTKTSTLIGDISKAKKDFNFDPKVDLDKLIKIMIDSDLKSES